MLIWLRRLLSKHLSYALDYIAWSVSKQFHQALATRISLRRYCHLQLEDETNKHLQVPGREGVSLETDTIFVPLKFRRSAGNSSASSLIEAFEKNARVTVVGDPGSGKSSLIKQTFRSACRQADSIPGRVRLPVMIELKRFTPPKRVKGERASGDWALSRLRDQVQEVQGFDMGQLFDSFVSGNGLMVLLDGLDEVASNDYPRTANAIRGLSKLLAQRSSSNIVVLTMRVQFHQQVQADFEDCFPTVYRIAPFSPSDIFSFLDRWPFQSAKSEQMSRIYGDLTDRPTLREMCRNPLVLAMYVANDQSPADAQAPPDTRTSFYDQVVAELLVERRSRQLGLAARTALREKREAILGRLALENLVDETQAANSPTWQAAVDIISDVYEYANEADAEEMLRDLERDTGIISHEREGESLRFIHLTFCEFLAAKEVAQGQENGLPQLLAHHDKFQRADQPQLRSRLNEVIPFATALLARAFRPKAIQAVAETCNQEILGRCFLETQAYRGDVWQDYLDQEQTELLKSDPRHWTDEWLSRLHLFNVVFRDAERWAPKGQTAGISLEGFFENLVGSDRDRLVRLFSSYAVSDSPAALRLAEECGVDLANEHPELVLRNCEFPPFLSVALQKAAGKGGSSRRWIALLAEAGLRSHLSALILHGQEAPKALGEKFSEQLRSNRWFPLPQETIVLSLLDTPPIKPLKKKVSAYSAILTLASHEADLKQLDLPALRILKKVPPPGAAVSASLVYLTGIIAIAGIGFALWQALQPTSSLAAIVIVILAVAVGLPILGYPVRRSRRYGALANLMFPISLLGKPPRPTEVKRATLRAILAYRLKEAVDSVYLRRLNTALHDLEEFRYQHGLLSSIAVVADET